MNKVRLVHDMNQFFAGLGGEEKTGIPPAVKESSVGPGQLLQSLLAERGDVIARVYCGDNDISKNCE